MKTKILKITLIFAMLMLFTPLIANAASSGTCGADGDNLTLTLDDAGTLIISGEGDMATYTGSTAAPSPWKGNGSIKIVIIEDGVTGIGSYAFYGRSSLTSVPIPDNVLNIGEGTFMYCSCLKSITIGEGVTNIGNNAFYGCDNLEIVYYNAKYCTKMGSRFDYVFENCSSINEILISDDVETISDYAFYNCGDLTSVTIGSSVTSIGANAFRYCNIEILNHSQKLKNIFQLLGVI